MLGGGERLDDPGRLAALRRTGLFESAPDDGFDRLTRLAARLLRAPLSRVTLVAAREEFYKSAAGLPEPLAVTRSPLGSESFSQIVVTTGQELVIPDTASDHRVAHDLAVTQLGVRSYAGVPLFSPDGHPLGSFCVLDTQPREWSADDREILAELAGSVMTEIGLGVAVREAEEAQARLALVAEASALLSSLDSSETLEKLARLAATRLADWCSISVVNEDGSVGRVAIAHCDPDLQDVAQQLRERFPHDPTASTGVPEVIRSGRAQLVSHVDRDALQVSSLGEDYNRLLRTLGFDSVMVVPLSAWGRTFGAISFARAAGAPYDERDLSVASDIGRRAGLALDNARAYEAQAEIAMTLQRSLLPPELPQVPYFEVAATYRTPGDSVLVGGDFYDLFPLRGSGWGVAIGDVQGKGSGAASLTALARYTVRAGALTLRNPKQVLRALNGAVMRESDRFLTICLMTLSPMGDRLRGRVCLAGHPPPFVLRLDGTVEELGRPGTLLGVIDDVDLSVVTFELRPRDQVVLFTDGLLEARRDGQQFGTEGIAQVLKTLAGQAPAQVVASLEKEVTEFARGLPRDDMAILALGRPLASED